MTKISEIVSNISPNLHWQTRRRVAITMLWPEHRLRAAEQDYRNGLPSDIYAYDADVSAIKLAIPKI